jgi:methylaspartate mutase sigma subunit
MGEDRMSEPAATMEDRPTVVLGVVGADVHIVGAKILDFALTEAGFHVVNLGIMVSQAEFIEAAIETDAEAVLVSSVYGHGEIDCRGFRDKCVELGAEDLLLMVGGNLVVGRRSWEETEAVFRAYGFDRVYPPGTTPETAIADLTELIAERRARIGR